MCVCVCVCAYNQNILGRHSRKKKKCEKFCTSTNDVLPVFQRGALLWVGDKALDRQKKLFVNTTKSSDIMTSRDTTTCTVKSRNVLRSRESQWHQPRDSVSQSDIDLKSQTGKTGENKQRKT